MSNLLNIKVLVAEDDFLVSKEISRCLDKCGFELIGVAPNGKKAVKMVEELKPDVVLMDIKMPVMDGIEATKIIQEKFPTPVVMLTAHDTMDLVERASEYGAASYLTKPPEHIEIERAITIALARHNDLMETKRLVNELKESKILLEQQKESLQELMLSRDKLFSIIAHDLRSPFQGLIGLTSLMKESWKSLSRQEITDIVDNLSEATGNIYKLLENLLAWARIQTGAMKVSPETLYFADIIESSLNVLDATAKNKNINIETHISDNTSIYADRNMVETIIRNLLSNSIKFTPIDGSIIITTSKNDREVHIEIKDTGVGMNTETINTLFKSNSKSTVGTAGEKGTGLGLLLCKNMIDLNNGKIKIFSKINEGSTFTISFPIKN